MKNLNIEDFSSFGSEPVNLAYVQQAEYLLSHDKAESVHWERLIRMLHYCINHELNQEPLIEVLGKRFDSAALRAYCTGLHEWKDAYRTLETLVQDVNSTSM